MVSADSNRISRVPPYSGATRAAASFSPTGPLPSMARLSSPLQLSVQVALGRLRIPCELPTTPIQKHRNVITLYRFGLFPFRSPLLGESIFLSLPPGTEMFQFPGFAPCTYEFSTGSQPHRNAAVGFPHSEISGSKFVWQLPEAFRSLPRLSSPLGAKASTAGP